MTEEEDNDDGGGEGAPAWMATFADLSTLLLTFFVLLFTFAEVDAKKFEEALGSIRNALGVTPSAQGVLQQMAMRQATLSEDGQEVPSAKEALNDVAELVETMVEQKSLGDQVKVETTSRGVIVQVKGQFFFKPGTDELLEQAFTTLDEIGEIMNAYPYDMAIEGHTDDIPISGRFASNWELSTARSYSALKYLEEKQGIDVRRIHIAGFGSKRPIAGNDTEEGRAENRRVEFVFFLKQDDPSIEGAKNRYDETGAGAPSIGTLNAGESEASDPPEFAP